MLKVVMLVAVLVGSMALAKADWVNGYYRHDGRYVAGYYRTPANGTPYDNLSYRGYPSQQPSYIPPVRMPTYEPCYPMYRAPSYTPYSGYGYGSSYSRPYGGYGNRW